MASDGTRRLLLLMAETRPVSRTGDTAEGAAGAYPKGRSRVFRSGRVAPVSAIFLEEPAARLHVSRLIVAAPASLPLSARGAILDGTPGPSVRSAGDIPDVTQGH